MNANNQHRNAKNRTGLFVLTALSILTVTASAFADVYTSTYNTGDEFLSHWSAGSYRPDGYVNPTSSNGKITNQNKYTKFDDSFLNGYNGWETVKRTSKDGAWTTGGPGWISPYSSATNSGHNPNGFYFYKFDLTAASGGEADLHLSGTYTADDYLASVMMVDKNGFIVKTIYTAGTQTTANSQTGVWQNMLDLDFGSFTVNADEDYSLVFVVHNTNGGGSSKENATGLNIEFTIEGNIDFHVPGKEPPPVSAVTPEPATLAVFGLGLAGLAVIRRRKK